MKFIAVMGFVLVCGTSIVIAKTQVQASLTVGIQQSNKQSYISRLQMAPPNTKVYLITEDGRELVGKIGQRRGSEFDLWGKQNLEAITYQNVRYVEVRRAWPIRLFKTLGEIAGALWEVFGIVVLRHPE